jgi:GWxTD domain-containing protein
MFRVPQLTLCAAIFAATLPLGAHAQESGQPRMDPRAIADSQAVLRDLDARVRANAKDSAAWYRRAMAAWSLWTRARQPDAPRDLDDTRLARLADTSFRIALEIAPRNVQYNFDYGRFLLASPHATTRSLAMPYLDAAYDALRAGADPGLRANIALEVGRVYWRRYDRLADRRIETTPGIGPRSLSDAMCPQARSPGRGCRAGEGQSLTEIRTTIEATTQPLPRDINGEADFIRAADLFREAYAAAPTHAWTFHHVAMMLAERSAWRELEVFAQSHLRQAPWHGNAWMALGLAMQRQGRRADVTAVFDSAFAYLGASERARLDRVQRLLPDESVARLSANTPAQLRQYATLYWQLADPLWSNEANDARAEFFARVAYAELRWTVPELGVRGAESDRGDIHIRYGPPNIRAVFGPMISGASGIVGNENPAAVSTVWIYDSKLIFMFNGMPTYATASTTRTDAKLVGIIVNRHPVRWDNLPVGRIDSLPTHVARFRGGRDSVDVFVATRDTSGVTTATRGGVWFVSGSGATVLQDSARIPAGATHAWRSRVAPGDYVVRVETLGEVEAPSGRSTTVLDAGANAANFAVRGFGMSDVLVAAAAPPVSNTPARWTDIPIAPSVGAVRERAVLVWENYDLANTSGSATYTVSISLIADRSVLGGIAARITGALANAARIDRRSDRLVMLVDRTVAYAPTLVDQITLELGDTQPGKYTLLVEVTDKGSARTVSRTQRFLIGK